MNDQDPKRVARLIASGCVALRVRRLGRVVTRIYDNALAPHGINIAQLNLLAAVSIADGARQVKADGIADNPFTVYYDHWNALVRSGLFWTAYTSVGQRLVTG